MTKHCFLCDKPFKNNDDIVAVVRSEYKEIPSRVHFAIANPTEVYEMQHVACAKGDLLPPDEFFDGEPED